MHPKWCEIRQYLEEPTCYKPTVAVIDAFTWISEGSNKIHVQLYVCNIHARMAKDQDAMIVTMFEEFDDH